MQTFLPYADFKESAKVLDMKRLGKQRVETLQVCKALTQADYGWSNHPAVKMWRGYLRTLYAYQLAVCTEWTSRGYRDTCLQKTSDILRECDDSILGASSPPWLGDDALHLSHQSNLIRKAPNVYRPIFGDNVPDNLEYVWPVK